MCLAVAGVVLSVNGNYAEVDIMGNVMDVNIMVVDAHVGDCVLVHAGCAIEVVKQSVHDEINALYKELEGVMTDA